MRTEASSLDESDIPNLQTPRLLLRPLQPGDAAVLHRLYQGDGVVRFFPFPVPTPLELLERFVTRQQEHWSLYGRGNWGILPQGEDEIIGWAGLQFLPELNETEVGYLLGRPFWGRGYATEAAQASLRFGFEQLALDHIIALVDPENFASQRVIQKCCMAYVDRLFMWDMHFLRYRLDAPASLPS
jgi:[ribosomal protein S5]-alanine N-acetyltransferase